VAEASSEHARTRLIIVDTAPAPDALLWVLSICAARQVSPDAVAFAAGPNGGSVRIEAARLSEEDALRLSAKLQAAPVVRGVSLGWRSGPAG
jgi:hypothetical protein